MMHLFLNVAIMKNQKNQPYVTQLKSIVLLNASRMTTMIMHDEDFVVLIKVIPFEIKT